MGATSSTVYMASPGSQAATAIITGSDYGDANREALTAGLRGLFALSLKVDILSGMTLERCLI